MFKFLELESLHCFNIDLIKKMKTLITLIHLHAEGLLSVTC